MEEDTLSALAAKLATLGVGTESALKLISV